MYRGLIDLSKEPVDSEAMWLVVASAGLDRWAALVSALAYSAGEFAFEFDPSSRTRRNFTCINVGRSPTSSRNKVDPPADHFVQ